MTYIVVAQDNTGRYVQTPGRHFPTHAEAFAYAETLAPIRDPRVVEITLGYARRIEGPDAATVAEQIRERPPLRCVDGTTLSVQASARHHCTPRDDTGPYTNVEVTFISRLPPAHWHIWCSYDQGEIFSQVPVAEVIGFLNDHGGLMEGELPPLSMGDQGW